MTGGGPAAPWEFCAARLVPTRLIEVHEGAVEPTSVYQARYLEETAGFDCEERAQRIATEVFDSFDMGSSVLLFGSGHSFWANRTSEHPAVAEVAVLDFVSTAGRGLSPQIDFYCQDILTVDVPRVFDYVFSAHTLEHFTREQILQRVLPECLRCARKAVVFLVPFATNWAEDPSHRCLFYKGDELFTLAERFKVIRNNIELVLWFRGRAEENDGRA